MKHLPCAVHAVQKHPWIPKTDCGTIFHFNFRGTINWKQIVQGGITYLKKTKTNINSLSKQSSSASIWILNYIRNDDNDDDDDKLFSCK